MQVEKVKAKAKPVIEPAQAIVKLAPGGLTLSDDPVST